jgi:hypothetical protein
MSKTEDAAFYSKSQECKRDIIWGDSRPSGEHKYLPCVSMYRKEKPRKTLSGTSLSILIRNSEKSKGVRRLRKISHSQSNWTIIKADKTLWWFNTCEIYKSSGAIPHHLSFNLALPLKRPKPLMGNRRLFFFSFKRWEVRTYYYK